MSLLPALESIGLGSQAANIRLKWLEQVFKDINVKTDKANSMNEVH